jgi:hypothetical protein
LERESFLTIGMATYDDYDGVYFSIQAIRLYHPEIAGDMRLLVVDNHPDGPCSGALKKLEAQIPGYRYVGYGERQGTAVRDVIFREARSQYVLSMDSHVMFVPGSLARLIEFLKARPESNDLWQGPLVYDDLTTISTHFATEWCEGMYGTWRTDERGRDADGEPFEIPMQGLGVFVCRKEAWPGFNDRFRGFGGEEGYIHEKIRRGGGRAMCLPFLRWIHRFDRPMGTQYPVLWKDRIRNYLIGHDELGLDAKPVVEHFEQLLGAETARPLVEAVEREIAGRHAWNGRRLGYGFGMEVDGWRVEIRTDRAETERVLDRYLGPWVGRSATGRGGMVLEATGGEDGAPYEFFCDGALVASEPFLEDLIPLMQAWLDDAIIRRVKGTVPVHAGAVRWRGGAVLLPGPSHAGKSTLVAELIRRGCVYYSDEYALIDGEGRANPYPRALQLRDGEGRVRPVLAAEWGAETGEGPAAVRLILALEYAANSAWAVRRVSQSDMVLTLLRHTPRNLAETDGLPGWFVRAAAGAACYAGARGEAAEAAGHILELLASGG